MYGKRYGQLERARRPFVAESPLIRLQRIVRGMVFVELTPFIYLIFAYGKSTQDDLTPKQVKTLAQLMKDIHNG